MGKLEEATKNYFLQCINEPTIIAEVRKTVLGIVDNDSLETESTPEVASAAIRILKQDDVQKLENRIDTVIESQKEFECTIKELLSQEYGKLVALIEEKEEKKTKEEILRLEIQKEELMKKYMEVHQMVDSISKENTSLNEQIEVVKSQVSPFKKHIEMWNTMETLNEETKEYIRQLCGGYSIEACMSLGRDDRKIEQLWSFLRDEILKTDSDNNDKKVLGSYFEYCLQIANSTRTNTSPYYFYDLEEGNDFNKELCIRTPDSKQIGQIKRVLMRCVKVGETVVYKAIVKVE